ncbi:hypothetical protein L798_05495 [Zootermopsis nevadensis]|uniref:Uncharacterized protein n=1 Tax=Zootermopsis nevadensis TaxID=136037 RepID=A0A067QHC3_ZOONE|nr:hypothetical protein L798_05495 [Zootermopsis nevadensis]
MAAKQLRSKKVMCEDARVEIDDSSDSELPCGQPLYDSETYGTGEPQGPHVSADVEGPLREPTESGKRVEHAVVRGIVTESGKNDDNEMQKSQADLLATIWDCLLEDRKKRERIRQEDRDTNEAIVNRIESTADILSREMVCLREGT